MSSMNLSVSVLIRTEAVRRLPTKNRLELFVLNSFCRVVLMDRIVFV